MKVRFGGHAAGRQIYTEVVVGTSVKIYLPRFVGDGNEASIAGPTKYAVASNRKETILVVEDDDRVRAISSETLIELGYIVVEAASARGALKK